MGGGNVPLKRELLEQRRLIDLPLTHHRFKSPPIRGNESAISFGFNSGVFQHNPPEPDLPSLALLTPWGSGRL
jgi:hypothetical protein